jgi:hypothetical protein
VTTRTVTLHAPARCTSGQTLLDGNAYADYFALGDFDPQPPPAGMPLASIGDTLAGLSDDTREIVVEATEVDRQWLGEGDVAATGNVDVLLTPAFQSCALSMPTGSRSAAVLGPFAGRRVLVVGANAKESPPTYVANLNTGAIAVAGPDLLTPRTGAGVTAFGTGALVAGGVDPRPGGLGVLDNAEVFDADLGGFDQANPILLSTARADPGAVVLATGETLLVGGVGGDGQTVLDSMEIVDPTTRTVRAENVASLAVARRAPTVLLLASGEILVFGGFDGSGNPVPTLEWFSSDASTFTKRATDLVAGAARACIALEGGGALAVITPPPGAAAGFQNTWVIDADGAVESATPVGGSLTAPVLFGGAGGAPVLWTGDRWLRWQPWLGSFGALGVLDDVPAQVGDATASPDPGLASWIDPTTQLLTALRFDTTGTYSPLEGPLLVSDMSDTAPDRLPATGVVSFDSSLGLTLGPGASVFVTDRTYADVTIDLDAPTGEPPLVVLRDGAGVELEVGGVSCPGALAGATVGRASSLHVVRTGGSVSWRAAGGASGSCSGASFSAGARLTVGLRGPADAAEGVVANLRLVRVEDP